GSSPRCPNAATNWHVAKPAACRLYSCSHLRKASSACGVSKGNSTGGGAKLHRHGLGVRRARKDVCKRHKRTYIGAAPNSWSTDSDSALPAWNLRLVMMAR